MSLKLEEHSCTAFVDGKPHGKRDSCTRVVTRNRAGMTLQKHWVCGECRQRMKLPGHSVLITHDGIRPWR